MRWLLGTFGMAMKQSLRRFVEFLGNAGVWVLESEGLPECGMSVSDGKMTFLGVCPPC